MIPLTIHQTWKDARLPEQFAQWHATWKRMNPEFEVRLWTDADIAAFIDAHYPEWQPVMRGYRVPISRIDLARYLILHHHGGVYADLDAECLRPIAPLLAGQEFLIGIEPLSHEPESKAVRRRLTGLLCPTVIASRPGHPFWAHLFTHLRAAADEADPLDATGPFLLTRARADYRGPPINVVAPEVFYPFDREQCERGAFQDRSTWPAAARAAYAIHYWEGSWWKPRGASGQGAKPAESTAVRVALFGSLSSPSGLGRAARGTYAALSAVGVPVSAFDIVDGPADRQPFEPGEPEEQVARRLPYAIPVDIVHTNPDLWLLTQSRKDPAALLSRRSGRFRIGFWAWEGRGGVPSHWPKAFRQVDEVWVPSRFTAQAVSDDLPVPVVAVGHPVVARRGGLDRKALGLPERAFCFLTVLDALSNLQRKNVEGMIRAFRDAFPAPTEGIVLVIKARNLSAEHVAMIEQVRAGRGDIRVISRTMDDDALASLMNACDAYLSLHRAEGFGLTVAEAMAIGKPVIATGYSATTEFMPKGTGYAVPYRMTTLRKPSGYFLAGTRWADPDLAAAAQLMRQLVAQPDAARETGARAARHIEAVLSPQAIGRKMRARLLLLAEQGRLARPWTSGAAASRPVTPSETAAVGRTGQAAPARTTTPAVLVLTPMKDTGPHLERYARLLESLDYPQEALSLGILEGDSRDDTWAALQAMRPRLERRCARVGLFKHDDGLHIEGPRWAPGVQRVRRAAIARARNRLLSLGLRDETWVLWLDADLLAYPPRLLSDLLRTGKEIVVPHCLNETGGTFDRNTFIFSPDRSAAERPEYLRDDLFQPPTGRGRAYLGAFRGQPLVRVDAVGGTALLVRADLHRAGLVFPAWPHRGYIETEGFSMIAEDMGIACWGVPDLEIVHPSG